MYCIKDIDKTGLNAMILKTSYIVDTAWHFDIDKTTVVTSWLAESYDTLSFSFDFNNILFYANLLNEN